MMRILLVDDHPVVRHGIRTILTERLKGAVVGEAGDADSALSQVRSTDWDLVVADISLPGMNGLDLIKELRRLYPTLPTVVVSMHPASQFARRALAAGAAGYLTKDSTPEEFIAAIEEARRGRRYVGPEGAEGGRWSAGAAGTPHDSLSDRAAHARLRPDRLRHRTRSEPERQDHQYVSHARAREARHANQCRADALRDREQSAGLVSDTKICASSVTSAVPRDSGARLLRGCRA
jgi:two-component system, NarL family, invasion response regulator UvrY